jgi:hypothetical protein
MVERIPDMPPGTVGLRAAGKLTRTDYRDVLEPTLREAVATGELRLLFVLTDFDGLEPSAWLIDVKTGLEIGVGHHSAWKRMAFVTDVDWVRKAMHTFAWMTPGEVMVAELDKLEEAKAWVAA